MQNQRQFVKIGKAVIKAAVPILYGKFLHRNQSIPAPIFPSRILLMNGFHIGDVVIATSIIPVLRRAYPSAEIGFLTGSWSQMVVQNHPDLQHVHCVDHWMQNRSGASFLKKYLQYRRTLRQALREIRAVKYDVSICLITNFPDFMDLAWKARIPTRITFRKSVFASLATSIVDEPQNVFVPQGARLAETLHPLAIDPAHLESRKPLPPDAGHYRELCKVLNVNGLNRRITASFIWAPAPRFGSFPYHSGER